MFKKYFFLGFLLFLVKITISQEVRPDARNAVIVLDVTNGMQKKIPYVNVSFEDLKTGKTFLGKTDKSGVAHVKVTIGETYKIKVNDILVTPRFFVVNRPFYTMPKSISYSGPVPKVVEEKEVKETIAKKNAINLEKEKLIPDKENVLIKLNMKNEEGSPLANQKISFTGRETKKTFVSVTNSQGKMNMLLPKGDFYDLDLEKKRSFMVIHLPKDDRIYGKTLNLNYKETE